MAGNLFSTIDEMDAKLAQPATDVANDILLVNGHDLERWLLKVLVGLVASGNTELSSQGENFVLEPWVELLFDPAPFAPPLGLFMPVAAEPDDATTPISRGLIITVLHLAGRPFGLRAELNGYCFVLCMQAIRLDQRTFSGRRYAYRPFELHTTSGIHEYSIVMNWDGPRDGGTINFTQAAI